MPTPRYEVIIYWSDEDQAFIAEVPELPGCASDGETYYEALTNVEVIIQEWIEGKESVHPRKFGDRSRTSDDEIRQLIHRHRGDFLLEQIAFACL